MDPWIALLTSYDIERFFPAKTGARLTNSVRALLAIKLRAVP